MSWATALLGIRERLLTVAGLNERTVLLGEPTAVHAAPLAYVVFGSNARTQAGQINANKYIALIRVVVPWQENQAAETELAPFVNSVPAAFDARLKDTNGHAYATLGGRVNVCQITNTSGGFPTIGSTTYRAVDFDLEITDKGPTGSGV